MYLSLCEMQGSSKTGTLAAWQVPLDIESWLQLEHLAAREDRPRLLLPFTSSSSAAIEIIIIRVTRTPRHARFVVFWVTSLRRGPVCPNASGPTDVNFRLVVSPIVTVPVSRCPLCPLTQTNLDWTSSRVGTTSVGGTAIWPDRGGLVSIASNCGKQEQ